CEKIHDDITGNIVDIVTSRGVHCGKGVQVDPSHILTAKHIVESSPIDPCTYIQRGDQTFPSQSLEKYPHSDKALMTLPEIEKKSLSISIFPESKITKDLSVFALVSRSGSWQKIEGKITNTSESYIGYDPTLRLSQIYTGALETDILLEAGESGTPIWTLSSELIGIMSAVDREKGRSYVIKVK
ncbi:trypsin-like peptidase domain-containing protein, partial [Candidatus Gracilibacteria bacterium]|nr:trypsin-like peptidase domain-containing protein [Candidatus Gracilibacteria bacterium]